MFIDWRGKRLRSKFMLEIGRGCGANLCDRARLAKIKQSEAKALGKKGRALGRKF
jgi:hypothetical protein